MVEFWAGWADQVWPVVEIFFSFDLHGRIFWRVAYHPLEVNQLPEMGASGAQAEGDAKVLGAFRPGEGLREVPGVEGGEIPKDPPFAINSFWMLSFRAFSKLKARSPTQTKGLSS